MEYAQTFYSMQFCCLNGDMCLAPAEAQPRDEIALIDGLPTPRAMRRKGDFYELIGACYVHGAMQGEALPRNGSRDANRHEKGISGPTIYSRFSPTHNYVVTKDTDRTMSERALTTSSGVDWSVESEKAAHAAREL